jgi:hypothetical protein
MVPSLSTREFRQNRKPVRGGLARRVCRRNRGAHPGGAKGTVRPFELEKQSNGESFSSAVSDRQGSSRRYLQHLKGAILHTAQAQGRQWDLGDGQIVVAVPASFDEVARSLTAEAAEAAGLGHVTLLEELQAAFYAWAARAGRQWRDAVTPGDIILVCDVGGGTADFSLIAVTDVAGNLELERISVGEHILRDNMNLALAYTRRYRSANDRDGQIGRGRVAHGLALWNDSTGCSGPADHPSSG